MDSCLIESGDGLVKGCAHDAISELNREFLITTNKLYRIRCKCLHGAIAITTKSRTTC